MQCVCVNDDHTFRCDLDHAKKSFYRSANAIFGKVGRATNEEVVVQLLVSKCIPILMYGLEACPLIKSQLLSLDLAVNRFFMKLFRTSSTEVVKQCQEYFAFEIPSVLWSKHVNKFENKL